MIVKTSSNTNPVETACQTNIVCIRNNHVNKEAYGGWLRSVGSMKLMVFFAECRLFYRALLQKRPIILSILLIKATHSVFLQCVVAVTMVFVLECESLAALCCCSLLL